MKQTAQTPHFKTAARIPESSLNTGLSVSTTTEPSPLPVSPDTQETPDMLEHDGKDVYAAQSAINNLSTSVPVPPCLTELTCKAWTGRRRLGSSRWHRRPPCDGPQRLCDHKRPEV
jgi:hypothetical protein